MLAHRYYESPDIHQTEAGDERDRIVSLSSEDRCRG
jgi:hypothetical protein